MTVIITRIIGHIIEIGIVVQVDTIQNVTITDVIGQGIGIGMIVQVYS